MFFSIIIPLFNRPQEIDELLHTLTQQEYTNFEVLVVVEDGSTLDARSLVESYQYTLNIRYFVKENEGQGFTRNFAFKQAKGDYFVMFDSDCLIPKDYLATVKAHLERNWLDAYGGPDAAHSSAARAAASSGSPRRSRSPMKLARSMNGMRPTLFAFFRGCT